ncbi:toxin co-regulated pilus biosynthesis Q family protein [Pandoraea cepalis]|uniref:Type IV pilus assembly protein n=1 Tax=Pandoraea cepalis TaxID=2508294 RepID=A0A5E4RNN7_9BURK|nr:toxin co-regulated pilus biosynthesis Q family protein [Pandoraea cepalis]VVD64583.1 type IV pilus assembly protein [Pandoraea cepalis]
MHIKSVLTAAVATTVWSSTVVAVERSQEAPRSPDLQIAFASHKPLMSGRAAAVSPPPPLASALDTAPSNDAPPEGGSTSALPTLPLSSVSPSPAIAASEPLAQVEVRELLELLMSPGDGRVSVALQRYLEAHGWQLAWEIDRDFPIEYPATFTGDFLGIVEQVVVSLQNTDAPIRVKVYEANRVLRVVHATQ